MKCVHIGYLTLGLLMAGCRDTSSDSLLDHEYDVVMGLLAPDSSSSFYLGHPTEIYVGKIIPTDLSNVHFIHGVTDTSLLDMMYCARNHYVAYYEYDSTLP